MPTATLLPNELISSSGFTSIALTDIDEDPDTPDAGWAVALSQNQNTAATVGFPTPAGNPVGVQTFKIYVRKNGGTGTPTCRIDLYESGSLLATGATQNVTLTGGQMLSQTFDLAGITLADPTGAGVQAAFVSTSIGGNPATRASVDLGAINWDTANYADPVTAVGASLGLPYSTRVEVGASRAVPYEILSGLAAVGAQRALPYTVSGETLLLGSKAEGTVADFTAIDGTTVWKFTAVESGTLVKLWIAPKVANAGESIKMGIYSHDAVNNRPDARLDVSTTVVVPAGTGPFSVDMPGGVQIASGTTYWIGLRDAGATFSFQGTTATSAYREQIVDFPNPYGAGGAYGDVRVAIWGTTPAPVAVGASLGLPSQVLAETGASRALPSQVLALVGASCGLPYAVAAGAVSVGARDFNGSSDYLEIDSALGLTDPPFTIGVWALTDDLTTDRTYAGLFDKDVATDWFFVGADSTGPLQAEHRSGGTGAIQNVKSVASVSPGDWHSAVGVFNSLTDRAVELNGVRASLNGNESAAAIDRFTVGRMGDSSPGNYHDGKIQYVFVWSVDLTEAEVDAFHAGQIPQQANLVEWWQFDGSSPEVGKISGTQLIVNGSTFSTAESPPVTYEATTVVGASLGTPYQVTTAVGASLELPYEVPITRRQHASGDDTAVDPVRAVATFASTPVEGNLLLATVFDRSGSSTTTHSLSGTGWVKRVADDDDLLDTTYRRSLSVWEKRAGASEPTEVTATKSEAGPIRLVIEEFRLGDKTATFAEAVVGRTPDTGEVSFVDHPGTGALTGRHLLLGVFGGKMNGNGMSDAGWDEGAGDIGANDDAVYGLTTFARSVVNNYLEVTGTGTSYDGQVSREGGTGLWTGATITILAFGISVGGLTAVGASRALPYGVTGAVGGARALPYSVRQEVGASRSLPSAVLSLVGASRALPFSARALAGASRSLPSAVRALVGDSRALPYGIAAAVGASRSLPSEIRAAVGGSRGLPYDIEVEVAIAAVRLYHVEFFSPPGLGVVAVGRSLAMPYTKRVEVAASRATPYLVLELVASARALAYSISAPVFAARALPYEVAQTAAGERGLPYSVLAIATSARSLPYTILQLATANRSLPYDVLGVASAVRSLPYGVRVLVVGDRALPYGVRALAAASRALPYEVIQVGAVGASRGLPYLVRVAVGASRALPFSLTTPVGAARDLAYAISMVVGGSRSLPYALRVAVGANRALPYDVIQVGAVGASRALAYAVHAVVGSARSLPYSVLNIVGAARGLPYLLRVEVAASRSLAYAVLSIAGAARAIPYTVRAEVTGSLALPYGIYAIAGASRVLAYGVSAVTGASRAVPYAVRALAGSDRALPYFTRAFVAASRSLPYEIIQVGAVSAARSLPYVVRAVVGAHRSLPFGISTLVSASRSLPYTLRALAAAARSLPYTVRAIVGGSRALPYGVVARVGASRTVNYLLLNTVAAARALAYALRVSATSSRSLPYLVRTLASGERALPYGLIAPATGAVVLPYDVLNTTGAARALAYDVRALAGRSEQFPYGVIAVTGASVRFPYIVLVPPRAAGFVSATIRFGPLVAAAVSVLDAAAEARQVETSASVRHTVAESEVESTAPEGKLTRV